LKSIVIYDTSYGNTKTIGASIADTLKESGLEVVILKVNEVKKLNPQDYDLLVLGSPTKFGTMSFAMKCFLGKVKGEEWVNKPFVAFDTENPGNAEKALAENKEWARLRRLRRILKKRR
jgi:menaquinone-dependent protoporphyrinogen IX oxidase